MFRQAMLLLVEGAQQAQGGAPTPTTTPDQGLNPLQLLIPFAVCFGIIWLLLIRPEKKRQREREAMVNQLKKNDEVMTTGGILGTVKRIKDNEVVIVIDEKKEVEMRVLKSALIVVQRKSDDKKEEPDKAEAQKQEEKK